VGRLLASLLLTLFSVTSIEPIAPSQRHHRRRMGLGRAEVRREIMAKLGKYLVSSSLMLVAALMGGC
jgi:hypothetical protein